MSKINEARLKKGLGLLLAMALIISVAGVGFGTRPIREGAAIQADLPAFDTSTFRRPAPNVTLDVTDVIRVGASSASMGPGTNIKKATPSGVPEITGTYATHAYAGETPVWPRIEFKSDKAVNIVGVTISAVGSGAVSATATFDSGATSNTTAANYEIRGGTASAGSLAKIDVKYTYTWNNPYTGINVTDEYVTSAYSYVENIIFPAGVWAFTAAGSASGNKADVPYISRILGRGVYGEIINFSSASGDYRSGYIDFTLGDYFTDVTAADFSRVMLKADPPSPGNGDRSIANGTGAYGSGSGDQHRGKATIYRETDSSLADNNVRMHFVTHKDSRSGVNLTWETIHTRDGDATYSGGTGNVLGTSGTASWAALGPDNGPKDGTASDTGAPYGGFTTAGKSIMTNFKGTGAAGTYTMIN